MTPNQNPLSVMEGALMGYALSPSEACLRLRRWSEAGVARALVHPCLLADIRPGDFAGIAFVGAVSFPAGGATLSTKRMELLECARLGAVEATVVLTPSHVLDMATGALETEMRALLSTAPELNVRFLVELAHLDESRLTHLVRLLKGSSPTALVTASGHYPPDCGHGHVRRLRAKLNRKTPIIVGQDVRTPGEWESFREAGAGGFVTSRPEAFMEKAP